MVQYQKSLKAKAKTETTIIQGDMATVRALLDQVRAEGRLSLSESEGKAILKAYGIPVPFEGVARTEEEAVRLAEKIRIPSGAKDRVPGHSHKTDVGGVVIGVTSR